MDCWGVALLHRGTTLPSYLRPGRGSQGALGELCPSCLWRQSWRVSPGARREGPEPPAWSGREWGDRNGAAAERLFPHEADPPRERRWRHLGRDFAGGHLVRQDTTGQGRLIKLGGQGQRQGMVQKQEKTLLRIPQGRRAGRMLSECRQAQATTAPSRSNCPRLTFFHSFPPPWSSEKVSWRGPEEAGVEERGKKPPRPAYGHRPLPGPCLHCAGGEERSSPSGGIQCCHDHTGPNKEIAFKAKSRQRTFYFPGVARKAADGTSPRCHPGAEKEVTAADRESPGAGE